MTSLVRSWSPMQWIAALAATVATAVVMAVPTGILHTPLYTRMTPVLWWNYPVWIAAAVLEGMIAATFVRSPEDNILGGRRAFLGGMGSFLAVGCPICNKVVVLLIGVGGALSFFAPIQPYLGIGSVAILTLALRQRLRMPTSCPIPCPVGGTAAEATR